MINLKGKKILVTGGGGFLGSHVINNLIQKRGVRQVNIFAPRSSDLNLTKWENCVKAVECKNIVIHVASRVGGIGFSKAKPGEIFYDNIMMGVQLMEAARQEGVEKFTAVGTVCSYPNVTPIPFKEENLWDGYPAHTHAAYGLSKKMYIVQGRAYYDQYGFISVHPLLVNLYGPHDNFHPEFSHVIPAIIQKIDQAQRAHETHVTLWGSGNASREFLFVEDAAEGVISITEKYDKPNQINIGSGKEIAIKTLAHLIAEMMEFTGEFIWDTSKPEGQPRRALDISQAREKIGFTAETSLEAGLKKTIEWYRHTHEEI